MTRAALMISVPAALLMACTPPENEESAATDMEETQPAAPAAALPPESADYKAILGGEQRSAENIARDQYRHPAETLDFFGLQPGMTVVEIAPGGGWYTEILAPAIGTNGTLYAAHADPASSERAAAAVADFQAKLDANPVYENTQLAVFSNGELNVPDGTADMVLTFRNVHNFHMAGNAEAAFQSFYDALKPGGILGVVDHRLPESADDARMEKSGYMKQSVVVALAEDAGFRLVDESDINANPKDTADYEKGVWTLPPTLTLGDTDRAKYEAIGESDRMTLKFEKPA